MCCTDADSGSYNSRVVSLLIVTQQERVGVRGKLDAIT